MNLLKFVIVNLLIFVIASEWNERSNPVKRRSRLLKSKFANLKRLMALLDCHDGFAVSQ
ncbi:MAG: hypothetical protein J6U11_02995 [Campylobacter sp.]|nr:hypothetical protein [Campylobacter sp.]